MRFPGLLPRLTEAELLGLEPRNLHFCQVPLVQIKVGELLPQKEERVPWVQQAGPPHKQKRKPFQSYGLTFQGGGLQIPVDFTH